MLLTIEKVAILKAADIFASTPDHVLASVAAIADEIDLAADETFIQEGAVEDSMYLIVDGEVVLERGRNVIGSLQAGEVVGEMEVLAPAPRSLSATAVSDTHLFRIAKDAFDEVMADRPEIAQGVIQVLVQRLRTTLA
ncbi:MAG: Crp/Fnr family transcriptional regulator [Chloroflexota bacterium]